MTNTGLVEINAICSDVAFNSCSSELFINGKFFGHTPIQLFLPLGSYNYELVKPGYFQQAMVGLINVQYGVKSSLDVELIDNTKVGALSVNSLPEGAHVFIDNVEQKEITPAIIVGITPGEHRYKLTLPGYADLESEFMMTLGQSTMVYNALVQLEEFGTVYIYSKSILHGIRPHILEGAKIYIDNVDTGKTIPLPVTGLTKGIHTFRVTMPNVEVTDGMFIINGGDVVLIGIHPILLPNTGIMSIQVYPLIGNIKNVKIYIDGKDIVKNIIEKLALPEGTHSYKLILPEYEDLEGKFNIETGHITMVSAYPIHINAPPLGILNMSSNPPGAHIHIDDTETGEYTPATIRNLSDGDYTYEISRPGYSDATGTFTIKNGNTVDINLTLIQSDTVLNISCNAMSTHIAIDNHNEGFVTPKEIIGLSPGVHTYRLFIPDIHGGGFDEATGTFVIEKNKITKVLGNLHLKKDYSKGNLVIKSIPSGAQVFIDDINTHLTTSYTTIDISPGLHKIKLSLPGYKDWIGTTYVIIGSMVSITEALISNKT